MPFQQRSSWLSRTSFVPDRMKLVSVFFPALPPGG